MQRLLERHGLPDLAFSHVDAAFGATPYEEDRRRWGKRSDRYVRESSEDGR